MKQAIPILRRVRGAVSNRDLVPILTYFNFYDGRVQGTNGHMTIDAALPSAEIVGTYPADRMIRVLSACAEASDQDASITLSKEGLNIKSGRFRAKVGTSRDMFPTIRSLDWPTDAPAPYVLPVDNGLLLNALARVREFVSEDAARPWSVGVRVTGTHVYATNNPIVVRSQWSKQAAFDGELNMPAYVVDELLRQRSAGYTPLSMTFSDTVVEFRYEEHNLWLRGSLLSASWPDVAKLFDLVEHSALGSAPEGLATAIRTLVPFCVDEKAPIVKLSATGVSTLDGEHTASIDGFELPDAAFYATHLLLVLDNATHLDLSTYPHPCAFARVQGKKVELDGVCLGVRLT